MTTADRCDVAILGGGLAGGFLARHLALAFPNLRITILEAAEEYADRKVGESTVELAANYMVRRLHLAGYLAQKQLPKNGLRFFFDSAERDLPLEEMSEIGSDHLPFHPSYQLERSSLERDIAAMNRASGVDVRLGAKVQDAVLGEEAEDHTVTFEQRGELRHLSARWVVDATGRRRLLARKLGLTAPKEDRLHTGAAWGRYRGVTGFDAHVSEAWRSRVRHTSRDLSTNHFMYDGYWIWFIPLAGGLWSVGVVFDRDRISDGPQNQAAFEAFLGRHRAVRELLEGAELVDFGAFNHLPYRSTEYFSASRRWALTGEAGAFTDPFYSPGSDFIATANEFIVDLIRREASSPGASSEDLATAEQAYNEYYAFKYESVLRLYARQYKTFGSFEVFRFKYLLEFNNYYNLVVWPFLADRLTDPEWLGIELRLAPRINQVLDKMADHFGGLADRLVESDAYHAGNRGRFINGLAGVGHLEPLLGAELDVEFRRKQADRVVGNVLAGLLERSAGCEIARREAVLRALDFRTVCVLPSAPEDCVKRLLAQVGSAIGKELRQEFPDAGRVHVAIEPAQTGHDIAVRTAEGVSAPPELLGRAKALWEQPGSSLLDDRAAPAVAPEPG